MQSRTPKIQEVDCHYAWSQGLPIFKRLIAILFVCLCVFGMKIVRLLTDPAIHGLDFAARRQNVDCSFGLVHHINYEKSQREPSEPLERPRIKSPPSYTKTTSTAYGPIRPMYFEVVLFERFYMFCTFCFYFQEYTHVSLSSSKYCIQPVVLFVENCEVFNHRVGIPPPDQTDRHTSLSNCGLDSSRERK